MAIASGTALVKRSTSRTRPRERGFTLVELLAAIVIIALLAALATPSFIAIMRDRRVTQVAVSLADTYREARARSLARGLAVSVMWQSNGAGKGTIEIRESVMHLPGQGLPVGCSQTADWTAVSTETRMVTRQNFASTIYELASIKLLSEGGLDAPFGQICFAAGRAYARYSDSGPFTSLAGVPHFEVLNTRTNLKRIVYLPPNGVARLAL